MSDVNDLVARIDGAFAAVKDKIKQEQQQQLQAHQERQALLKEYEKLQARIVETARPRLDALAKRAGEPPLSEAFAGWRWERVDAFLSTVESAADGNFLYLHHFFSAAEETLTADEASGAAMIVPKGLDEVYRVFAVEKI